MSTIFSAHPRRVQSIRDEAKDSRLSGVMSQTFRCRTCKQPKATTGRKKHLDGGFKCAACAVSVRKTEMKTPESLPL